MNVLMTGASGLIGSRLVEALREGGETVIPLVRKPTRNPHERYWDSEAESLSPDLLASADVLIHLAGDSIAGGRWTERKKQRIADSRVRTTRVLAETLARMADPPRTFIVASAIGFYGDSGQSLQTEESPSGENFLAKVCRDWESAADAARDKTRVVHVRTSMVLSEKGGALKPMLPPFKLGVGGVIGSGEQYWSWITLTDIVRLYQFAIANETISGPLNGSSPHPVTCREFTKTLGARLHRPTVFPLPAFLARIALGEMADELILASCRVFPAAATAQGFRFEDPELAPALTKLPL